MKKILLVFCALFCVFCPFAKDAKAYAKNELSVADIAQSYAEKTGFSDVQSMLDSDKTVGGGNELLVYALFQSGAEYGYSRFVKNLKKYVRENEVFSATTREKYAFILLAFRETEYACQRGEDVGALGIMSYVYALHLVNNGVVWDNITKSDIVSAIYSLQHEDGGWGVFSSSDVDVTAMCLQALAGTEMNDKTEKGFSFLSQNMTENGFYSMGEYNCESAAQVLLALNCWQISIADKRFVKNGKNVYDYLMDYSLPDGTFCHKIGDGFSAAATEQAACALASFEIQSFFTPKSYIKAPQKNILPINAWIAVALSGLCAVVCSVLLILKKISWKDTVIVCVIVCGVSLFIGLSTFETPSEYYLKNELTDDAITVLIEIVGVNDEIIVEKQEISVSKNGTVFDAITEIVTQKKIPLSYSGNSFTKSVYINAINGLAEFDYGAQSGWKYSVNGEECTVGVSARTLTENDYVRLFYTVEWGK